MMGCVYPGPHTISDNYANNKVVYLGQCAKKQLQ